MPADYFVIAESEHELQNPTSEEKLRRLGHVLRLASHSRVLDVASGRGGPAVLLASEFGCTVHGIELRAAFQAAAVERAERVGVADRVRFELRDAASVALEPGAYDVALCLGASFVYGGLAATIDALEPAVRTGGHVVIGEPYWRRLPPPEDDVDRDESWTTLEGTTQVFEASGLPVVSAIASSEDDWDRYETLHWRSLEEWLAANRHDSDAAAIRVRYERSKRNYLRRQRELLGWALFVGWKRPP